MRNNPSPVKTFVSRPFFNGSIIDENIKKGCAIIAAGCRDIYENPDKFNGDNTNDEDNMQEFVTLVHKFTSFTSDFDDAIGNRFNEGITDEALAELRNICHGFDEIMNTIKTSHRNRDTVA